MLPSPEAVSSRRVIMRPSSRIPADLAPNRLAAVRARLGNPRYDLTVSNPTRCGFAYPTDLLRPLAEPRGLLYSPDPRGPISARRAVAATFRRWDLEPDPAAIVLTASTSEAYGFLFRLLADPGDAVLAPVPSYPLIEHLARLDGVATAPLRLDPDDGWRIDRACLDDAPAGTRAVVVVHPNNPTGSHLDPDDAAWLTYACATRGWALVVDEVFLAYPLDAPRVTSFAATGQCLTFVLGGLSKLAGLPQLKLSWIVVSGPTAEVEAALEGLDYIADSYLSVSTPVALATAELLRAAAPVEQAIANRCRGNLAALRSVAARLPAVTVPPVGGGWSAMVRVPAVLDEEELALGLLERHSVAVHPGYFFDFAGPGWLVVSLLPEPHTFSAGAAALLEELDRRVREL